MPPEYNDPKWYQAYKSRMRWRCMKSPTPGTCCLCGDSGFAFMPCPQNQKGMDAGLHCPHWVDVPGAAEEEENL